MAVEEFYTTRQVKGVVVIGFTQAQLLDAVAIDRMSHGLREVIDDREHEKFLLDFSKVSYLSSSALGMLVGLQRHAMQRGARLKLSGIREEIMEVFRITKLDTVFDIYRDAGSAVEALESNQ